MSKLISLLRRTDASNSAVIDDSRSSSPEATCSIALNSIPALAAATASLTIESADPLVIVANTAALSAIDFIILAGATLFCLANAIADPN